MDRHALEQVYKDADALYQAGAYQQALSNLDMLNAEWPDDKDILYARARCLIALDRKSEAREAVDYLIHVLGAPRAKNLLAKLDATSTEHGAGSVSSAPIASVPPSAVLTPASSKPAKQLSSKTRALALAALLIMLIGSVVFVYQQIGAYGTYVEPASTAEETAMRDRRAAANDPNRRRTAQEAHAIMHTRERERDRQKATDAKAREDTITKAKAPETEPGREIPREEWLLTAINGIPDWKPGIYRDVPCKGNGTYTITVYVPMAFQERPHELFAGLMISMPEGNPGFQEFKDYAELNDMIIVCINNSSNAAYRYNQYAQELAFNTIVPSLRLDPTLGFTYGASGGARTNWDCMCRNPANFAGLMQVVFGDGDVCKSPPPGVRVAFLYGEQDFNRKATERLYNRLLREGYDVQAYVYAGDHGTPPPQEIKLYYMDWLVGSARRDRGLPHPPP